MGRASSMDGRDEKLDVMVWIGFNWLSVGTRYVLIMNMVINF
jgi:hypothetical protein